MNFLFLNVQSPPVARCERLLHALSSEQPEVMVLSELSSAEGSQRLADGIARGGYTVHWLKPQRHDYAVLLAIRAGVSHRLLNWSADYGVGRARFVLLRYDGAEMVVGGVYAPSLNRENLGKRAAFFQSMKALLAHAATGDRVVVFGGDINEIPPWHVPAIEPFTVEGHPFHSCLHEIDLADLAKSLVPPRTYSWFARDGGGQLLDAAFISARHAHKVTSYAIDDSFLKQRLTDHCALRMHLSL